MQSLRRIPAGAQVRVLFPNRSYAASTSNTDALTLRLNAISRLNSRNFLRFDDRNLVRADFLCFQRRGLRTGVQNSEGKKKETLQQSWVIDAVNERLKNDGKEKLNKSEIKEFKAHLRLFCLALFLYFVISFWNLWSDRKLTSKLEKQYASYLSTGSVPFDDSIEKLLKSGKVMQIIHLRPLEKAVALLKPGAVVDGVTAGEEYVVLNLKNNSRYSEPLNGFLFILEVRRVEEQIGIGRSKEVRIKIKGDQQLWLLESEMKEIKGYLRLAFLSFVALQFLFVLSFFQTYWISKSDSELKSKVGMQYALYLSSESVPFEDSIEKLLKSGKVTQIIHLMQFEKAVAVLSPGAIVDGVTEGEEAVVLNLENSAWKVRRSVPGFAQEVRRVEKQIGIEPSNNVPIKVEGEVQLWPQWILFTIFLAGALTFRRNIGKARALLQGKLTA
ncbi:hypothetical protein Ddc_19654 [Ditylenchus destructor]|nr:hypothetical protein Ddc_19654 [Ditylenchus destructor]